MLRQTFVHVPGIGEKTERDLWRRGFTDWDAFERSHPPGAWRDLVLERLQPDRAASDLPKREAWRLSREFEAATLFLDIETTGLALKGDVVTCVGVSDGTEVKAYVRGENLDRFPEALCDVRLLVTYNGASFDLPVLARAFPGIDFARFHHVDLRFPLRRLGLTGGLKGVERALDIARPEALVGVDGSWPSACGGPTCPAERALSRRSSVTAWRTWSTSSPCWRTRTTVSPKRSRSRSLRSRRAPGRSSPTVRTRNSSVSSAGSFNRRRFSA